MISLTGTVVEGPGEMAKLPRVSLAFVDDLETNLLVFPGEMVKDKLIAFKKFGYLPDKSDAFCA